VGVTVGDGITSEDKMAPSWDAALRCPFCGEMNCNCEVDMSYKKGYIYFIGRKCKHCGREWLEEWRFEGRHTCLS